MRSLTFIYILISGAAFSQTRVVNTNLSKPDTNLIYVGVEQILEITSKNKKIDFISADGGVTIKSLGENKYSVLVMSSGVKRLVIHYPENKQSGYDLKAVWLPQVTAQLGSITTGSASREQILKSPFVNVFLKDCLLKMRYNVEKFEARIYDPTGSVIYIKPISGNAIKIGDAEFISKLVRGNKLEIRNITAVSEAGIKVGAIAYVRMDII